MINKFFSLSFAAAVGIVMVLTPACKQDTASTAANDSATAAAGNRPSPAASPSLKPTPADAVNSGQNTANRPSEAGWPNDVPAYVPKPQGVELTNYTRTMVNGADTWTVMLADGKVTDLKNYEAQLKAAGFKTGLMAGDKGGILNAKKDNTILIMTITPTEKQLMIQLHSK